MKYKHVALVSKYHDVQLEQHIVQLAQYLDNLGITVYIDCNENCDTKNFVDFTIGKLSDWLDRLELVIVVGGDGTLLSAARIIANLNIPIIGVNRGKLGFMTDIAADEMLTVINDILLNTSCEIESRSLLFAEVYRNDQVIFKSSALNDIVISRGAIGNMIEFDIFIDKQFVLSQKSDGIIFSTPTGSTAYSLAAGGPILHPEAMVFSIVPICPQSLSNRPLVVNDNVVIEFVLFKDNATQIHFDGQECFNLVHQDRVIIKKQVQQLKLIHPSTYNYYNTLRTKLDWSKRVS